MDLGLDRNLTIALVTETWPPEINGVAMTLSRLVDGLRLRGHTVDLVRPRQQGDPRGPVARAILRNSLPIPRYSGLRLGLPCRGVLTAHWRRDPPDLVHIATEGPLGCSALAAARGLGIPTTSGFHTNFHDYMGHYGLRPLRDAVVAYLRRFHNRTRRTLVPTEAQVGDLATMGFHGVEALGRGVDTELFHPRWRSADLRRRWGADDDTLVCLHVGRVAPEKDIPLALDAFTAIRAVLPKSLMVVTGDGPERVRLQAAHPHVVFTGVLGREDLAQAYASSDLFLFPSLSETFGNVVLEAMASGLPAVCHDYAAPALHIRSGEDGWLVPCGDRSAFIAAAVTAARHADRAGFGRRARNAVLPHGWDGIVDRFVGLLRLAIEEHQTREAA